MAGLRSYAHKYDIRGRVSPKFGRAEAYAIGRGFSSVLVSNAQKNTVVVGYDVRDSSSELAAKLIEGFIDSGITVLDIGTCTTPMVRFASLLYETSGSIMVTASHNSLDDNGFKFTLNGGPFYDASLQKLCDIIESHSFVDGHGSVTQCRVKNLYIANMIKGLIISDDIRVVWIARNRVITQLLEDILQQVPGQHMIDHDLRDFKYFKPDVIFDFDTDADRMIMIDHNGRQWYGDETLSAFALNMKQDVPDLKVIFDLKASRVLMSWLESIGVRCEISRIGSCFIDQKMKTSNAQLGGETSGHFMFYDYNFLADDGIYAALRMIHYLSRFSGNLQDISQVFPPVHISKSIKISCGENNKHDILDRMKNHVSSNNLVIGTNEEGAILIQNIEGWYLIRVSETENALSVRCEGFDRDGLYTIQDRAEELLSTVGLSLW